MTRHEARLRRVEDRVLRLETRFNHLATTEEVAYMSGWVGVVHLLLNLPPRAAPPRVPESRPADLARIEALSQALSDAESERFKWETRFWLLAASVGAIATVAVIAAHL
jgi:hypothetical protein